MATPVILAALLTSASVSLAGGLWPFGNDDDRHQPDRIDSLPQRQLELKAEPTVDDGAMAREQYRRFLEMSTDTPALQNEAMRRLGDLNLAAGQEGEISGDLDASKAYFSNAVTIYSALLNNNPGYENTDQILYQLARAGESIGRAEEALATLDRLVADYPDSRYFAEAQFRRGEILFMQKQFHAAELAYAAVIDVGPASAFYEQALYKHGWALFKDGMYEESLLSFMTLLDRRLPDADITTDHLDVLSRPERELLDDTFRVMSIAFAYLDGHRSVISLLDQQGARGYANLLFENLGDLYIDQERFTDAAAAYTAFVKRQPTHRRAPGLQVKVIESHTLARFPELVLESKREYVRLFGMETEFWATRQRTDFLPVMATLKESLSDLAAWDHSLAQQNDDDDAYLRAADWYRRYLTYFPEDPDSAERNYLLADILFELELFAQASREYQRTAYHYGMHQRAAAAAYAGLLSARAHVDTVADADRQAARTDVIDQSLRFASTFPSHEQALPVLTKMGEEQFAAGQRQAALVIAGAVLYWQPQASPEQQKIAWTIVAHANFERERYAYAEQAYLQLAPVTVDAAARQEVDARIAASVYRQAEQARATGNDQLAVEEFLRVAEVAPESEFVSNALFDAAALQIKQQRWEQAVAVLQRFRRQFPQHGLAEDAAQKLALAYREAGQTMSAAAEFEALAGRSAVDQPVRREALWEAAELYAAVDSVADQRRVYAQIVAEYPEPFDESLEAQLQLAELANQANDLRARNHWLNQIITADARAGAARTVRSRTLAAEATLELAEPARNSFRAVELKIPLQESLKTKKTRMEYALAAYGAAADYGVAEVTTAATYEIAELYFALSQALLNSERPKGLTTEELEQYDILLEEQAFPFEEQAIDILVANTERTREGIYNEWVRKSFTRLAVLMPARYAKPERSERLVAILD